MMSEVTSSGKSPEGDQFVRRLFGLPIMATAIGQLSGFYTSTKERNRLLRFTLETAESGVSAIVNTAVPVVSRFDKEIVALNYIACAQLDLLEDRCPIITKPTDEVVKETKDLCCVAVQPIVSRVNSVKNYGYNKVIGIRTYTGEKISGMKTYGLNTVATAAKVGTDQVTRVLSTPVCRGVVNKFDLALDIADRYVDDYLPSECGVEASPKNTLSSDRVLLSKAYQLGSKVQRRLYCRTMKRMRGAQLRARKTIGQLNYTVDLIEYARSGCKSSHDKLQYYWQEINKMEDRVTEDAANEQIGYYDSNFERKAIATARHLTARLKSSFSWIESSSVGSIPEAMRGRLGRLQEMAHSLSEVFSKEVIRVKGLPNSALENARSTMVQIYDSLSDLVDWTLKNSSSPSLVSSLLGYGQSHENAKHSENDAEKMEVDSENPPQKEECEATSDREPAGDEEDQTNDTTGMHQRDEEEEEESEEEEKEDKEENATNRCAANCDTAEPRCDDDESSKNDETREDKNMEETKEQLKEDVKEQETGVDEDKGKDPDGCDDLQEDESQTENFNEYDLD